MRSMIVVACFALACGGGVQPVSGEGVEPVRPVQPVSSDAASLAGTYSGSWTFGLANPGGGGDQGDPPAIAFPAGNDIKVAALGGNALELIGFCGSGSAPVGTAISATSATFAADGCAGARLAGCDPDVVTFMVTDGSAILTGARLKLTLTGAVSACGESFDASMWTFTGTRQATQE